MTSTQPHDPAREAAEYALAAGQYLQDGRRGVAEVYARIALDFDPGNAEARTLLSQLAAVLRWPDRFAAAPSRKRYLLVREWSAGFWSDVDHALGMCLLAEITGRIPLVWWGAQSRFSADGSRNAWEQFFEPVSDATLTTLADLAPLSRFPAKWQGQSLGGTIRNRWSGEGSRLAGLELLDRDEDVVVSDFHNGMKALLPWLPAWHPLAGSSLPAAYRHLARKYLRPRPEITAEVERFAAAQFGGRPVVGVHLRGSDKVEEVSQLEGILNRYFQVVDERLRARPQAALFLLTDDERVRKVYGERYGSRLIATTCARSSSNVGVHYLADRDPRRTGIEVMVDAYLAARCDEFIGLGFSNVSLYVSYLKDWPAGRCLLLDENAHEIWNVMPFLMDAPPGAA